MQKFNSNEGATLAMKINGYRRDTKRFLNKNSKSIVQTQRLDNYSSLILDILEEYANEIDSSIIPYNKKSSEETMMIKGLRKSSQETTNRKIHMENVEGIAVEIAKKLGLHTGVTRIIARNHDLGHTFLGHSGEWWLSNVKEDYGIGYYTHNALGPAELIYRDNIYNEILDRIKAFNPDIRDSEIARIRKSLWLIFDGINAHNGEKTETEFIPDTKKDESRFQEELESCFTKKGYDKGIMPATLEGCLIRVCDKISYVPYDMVDGLREGIIDKIDGDYVPVLNFLGITMEEIEKANLTKNYEAIARKLQILFTKDVIENSTSSAIRMSNDIARAMHELRNINNREIVQYAVLGEDNQTYPQAIKTLMERFSNMLLSEDVLDTERARTEFASKYQGTPYEGFSRYLAGVTDEEFAFTKDYVCKAIRQSIEDEQAKARDVVLSGTAFSASTEFPNRDKRIRGYINYYMGREIKAGYSEEEAKQDADERYAQETTKEALREKLSLEFGAKYLASLNDIEFFKLLKDTKLITTTQAESLTRKYKDIGREGLKKEVYVQEQFGTIMKAQEEDTEKVEDEFDR